LRERRLDVLFVSDLTRAADTAAIALGESGLPAVFDTRLRECNDGDLNGCAVKQLAGERRQRITVPFPGGESYIDVTNRTAAFPVELAAEWDHRRVGVIAHSAYRWALEHLLNGRELVGLVEAPFAWQPGWWFDVPTDWRPDLPGSGV
jgi:alpha-ribazole phosphatase/probable phosphoglycerate mutase